MTKLGASDDSFWPMMKPVNDKPSAAAYANGLTHLVTRYETCGYASASTKIKRDVVNDVKVALASGYPVVFGTPLLSGFFDVKGKLNTHLAQYNPPLITFNEADYVGNHAMCIIGYDDAGGYFIVENSWGPTYADGGFVAISYESFKANAFQVYVPREFNGLSHQIPEYFYIRNGVVPVVPTPAPAPVVPTPEPEPAPVPTPAPTVFDWKKYLPFFIVGLFFAAFFLL